MGYGDNHLWHKDENQSWDERAAEIQQEARQWLADREQTIRSDGSVLALEKEPVMADKSVLDNIPVKDEAFPLTPSCTSNPSLTVVSKCPHCGNPIYGNAHLTGEQPAEIKRTCNCFPLSEAAK